MENQETSQTATTEIQLPSLTRESGAMMLTTARWGKFLAIFGFIISGLILLLGIAFASLGSFIPSDMLDQNLNLPFWLFSVIYIVLGLIYLVPVVFLNTFSNKLSKAINNNDTPALTDAFRNLRNLFVFTGALTIFIISVYLLILLFVGIAAVTGF
jgi:hypothetical protein